MLQTLRSRLVPCALVCLPALLLASGGACTGDRFVTGADGGASVAGGAWGSGGSAPCDPREMPDASVGVFVAAYGSDSIGDGSQAYPFATVGRAIGEGKPRVYVRQDVYPLDTTLVVAPGETHVTIDGGWTATWARACDAPEATVLAATFADAPAVRVDGGVTLARLTVATPANAPPALPGHAGASLLALLVHSGQLTLSDARLVAGDASDGGAALAVEDAMAAAACDGLTDCDSAPGAAGEPGAAGVFGVTAEGFVPGDGADGTPGGNGKNGTPGAKPNANSSCVQCTGKPSSPADRNDAFCAARSYEVVKRTGVPGACGCGGKGGAGGKGGKGGGASAALLVASGASASVEGVHATLQAGRGGSGAPGGSGAKGARGAPGHDGERVECFEFAVQTPSCVYGSANDICFYPRPPDDLSGEAGTRGSPGETGGPGGPGVGGPSYGAVTVGDAAISVDDAMIAIREGGVAGDGETRAEAATRKRF